MENHDPPTTVGMTPIRVARLRLGTTAAALRAAGALGAFTRDNYPDEYLLLHAELEAGDRYRPDGTHLARLTFCQPRQPLRSLKLEVAVERPEAGDGRSDGTDPYRAGLARLFNLHPAEVSAEERKEFKELVWLTVAAVRAVGARLEAEDRHGGNPSDAELWELADGILDAALDLLGEMPTSLDELFDAPTRELRRRYDAACAARRRFEAAQVPPAEPTTIKERATALRQQIAAAEEHLKEARARFVGLNAELEELQASCRDENKEKLSGAVDCSGDSKWRCLDCGKVWWE